MADNYWKKNGDYYPNWIEEDREFFRQHAEFVIGKRSIAPIREKNPMTDNWISEEELIVFSDISGRLPKGNPYKWLIAILEKMTGLQFPELPANNKLQADWSKMFLIWFFETKPIIEDAYWVNDSKTIFNSASLYTTDLVNSVSFQDINNKDCIKHQFFEYSDEKRPNPLKASFSFTGTDSGRENYYSWPEWFIGSYSVIINWIKNEDESYELTGKIMNTSSWYSGTRLPKTWQDKIEKTIGFKIKNLVNSAPRGETIKKEFPLLILETFEYIGFSIPSFGGNWEQEFDFKTKW